MFEEFELKIRFPKIKFDSTKKTSAETPEYNCIAWAAEENDRKWWPDRMQQHYWPKEVPRESTLEAFIKAFETLGYEGCDNGNAESGFQKIAIYTNAINRPTHAARQLPAGNWTSKLGDWIDISHDLEDLNGTQYGKPVHFMKRKST